MVKLDWSKAENVSWHNKSFLDVPYYLDNGQRYVPGADGNGTASFNLVIHLYKNGDYRAAIRTTSYDGLSYETSTKVVQFYEMLDGRPMNIWYKDARRQKIVSATQINISKEEYQLIKRKMSHRLLSSKVPGNSRTNSFAGSVDANMNIQSEAGSGSNTYDSANCTITETTTYYDCSGNGNPGSAGEGEYADPVVVAVCPFVTHTIVCVGETPGNTGGGGGPSTGGSGTSGGSNGDNNESPDDCNDEAPPPPPPPPSVNPDGTTAPPYESPTPCELFLPEEPPKPDPCATAKAQIAEKRTKLKAFIDGLKAVKEAAAIDGKEHSIAINQNTDGTITVTPVSQGADFSVNSNLGSKSIANLHNHPNTSPPSAGDVYSFIQNNSMLPNYTTKFVVTQDGSIYALIITNQLAAQDFSAKYPKSILPGSPPEFTEVEIDGVRLFDEYQFSREFFRGEDFTNTEANEGALAYILDSFNAGIALLKMNDDGSFSKINTKKTGGEGPNSTFVKNKCQ
ncbi:hypothetical protein GCM10027566_32990 [Arachidicoccus ginsenosidivorans]